MCANVCSFYAHSGETFISVQSEHKISNKRIQFNFKKIERLGPTGEINGLVGNFIVEDCEYIWMEEL